MLYPNFVLGKTSNHDIAKCSTSDELSKEEETADSVSDEDSEVSTENIFMNKMKGLKRCIVLNHRRYKKRTKRSAAIKFYREKYDTKGHVGRGTKEEASLLQSSGKSTTNKDSDNSVFRFIRNKLRSGFARKRDSASERIVIKLEERKKSFTGMSRDQIVAHFRTKYSEKR